MYIQFINYSLLKNNNNIKIHYIIIKKYLKLKIIILLKNKTNFLILLKKINLKKIFIIIIIKFKN